MLSIGHPAAGLAGLLVVVILGAASAARAEDGRARGQVERLGHRRIFFGHQSVGMNVLQGLEQVVAGAGGGLRVADAPAGAAIPPGTVGHAWLGENQQPASKLDAFARAMDALPPPGVDVALLKFCYVDFGPGTDAPALFARYRATLAELARRHPRTTFVHVTAPLSTVQGGVKALLKRALGREPAGLVENVRREEFNALLREAYQGREPIFDLARVEATAPDGRGETVTWQGRAVPALVPAYTDDGGHLNAAGRERAARALLETLAGLPAAPPAGAPR